MEKRGQNKKRQIYKEGMSEEKEKKATLIGKKKKKETECVIYIYIYIILGNHKTQNC